MAERIGNLTRRESMSIGSEDGMRARLRFPGGLLEWCLGIFVAILLGLATIFIAPAGPTLASSTSTSPTPSARIQGTPGANKTNAASAKKGVDATRKRAAGPCIDKTKRYNDCGNGTVTDTLTGLIWLKQATCLATADWEAAKKEAAGLKDGDCGLTDGSSPGDWRLPTSKEWEETMAKAKDMQCSPGPMLTNDAGAACIGAGPSSFTAVESDYYWSSTPLEGQPRAYFGDVDHGNLLNGSLVTTLRVWPVRGGR
jgi:hypothetical protein